MKLPDWLVDTMIVTALAGSVGFSMLLIAWTCHAFCRGCGSVKSWLIRSEPKE